MLAAVGVSPAEAQTCDLSRIPLPNSPTLGDQLPQKPSFLAYEVGQ